MSERRLFLDRSIGETRGVVLTDGWPERLIIVRDGDDQSFGVGAKMVARVRHIERAFASAFLELPGGGEAILALKADMPPLTQGAAIEIEIKSEARRDKLAIARFLAPAQGAPRLLSPAPGVAEHLQLLVKDVEIETGAVARQVADDAEAEALDTIHPLHGGGSIAIEPTRALVAVDVDLGGRGGQEAKRAARFANMMALSTGARLLRLKGLGGLVVFDLVGRGHDGHALAAAARTAFAPDNPGVSIGAVSRFGTMEMTIPRRRRPVLDLLLGDDGRLTPQTLALRLARMLEREGRASPGARLQALCAPPTAQAMATLTPALTDRLGARFEIVAKPGQPADHLEVVAR